MYVIAQKGTNMTSTNIEVLEKTYNEISGTKPTREKTNTIST